MKHLLVFISLFFLFSCKQDHSIHSGVKYILGYENSSVPAAMRSKTKLLLEKKLSRTFSEEEFNIRQTQNGFEINISQSAWNKAGSARIQQVLSGNASFSMMECYSKIEMTPALVKADSLIALKDGSVIKSDSLKGFSSSAEQGHPLFDILIYYESSSSFLGISEDTVQVNKYLHLPEIQRFFPDSVQFLWQASQMTGRKQYSKYYELYALHNPPENCRINSGMIEGADVQDDPITGLPTVILHFDENGKRHFKLLTARNVGLCVAMVLNEKVLSVPRVESEVNSAIVQVSGHFTQTEAETLAGLLESGAFPASLKIVSVSSFNDSK